LLQGDQILPPGNSKDPMYLINTCQIPCYKKANSLYNNKTNPLWGDEYNKCYNECSLKESFTNQNNKSFSFKTILLYIFMILLIYFIVNSSS